MWHWLYMYTVDANCICMNVCSKYHGMLQLHQQVHISSLQLINKDVYSVNVCCYICM